MSTRRGFLQFILTTPLSLALPACHGDHRFTPLPSGTKVVTLGDSLTFGYGVDISQSYPTLLANKTGWHIINAGVNGDTTQNILERLVNVINENPKLVLLVGHTNPLLLCISDQLAIASIAGFGSRLNGTGGFQHGSFQEV